MQEEIVHDLLHKNKHIFKKLDMKKNILIDYM